MASFRWSGLQPDSTQPVSRRVHLIFTDSDSWLFGPGSKFGFKNPLPLFNLRPPNSVLPHHPARDKFGFGYRALPHQNIPLLFFNFLPNSHVDPPTHNRKVHLSVLTKSLLYALYYPDGELTVVSPIVGKP
jgi:hypothetical protein